MWDKIKIVSRYPETYTTRNSWDWGPQRRLPHKNPFSHSRDINKNVRKCSKIFLPYISKFRVYKTADRAHCTGHNFRFSNAYNSGTEAAIKIRFSPKRRSGAAAWALVSSVCYCTPSWACIRSLLTAMHWTFNEMVLKRPPFGSKTCCTFLCE